MSANALRVLVFLTQHFPWRHDIPKGTKKGVEQNQQKKTNKQTNNME